MNPLSFVILLQLFGVAVVIAEIILPSGGLLSLLAAGLFGYGLYIAFYDISREAGIFLVFFDILLIPILILLGFKLMVRTPVTLRKTLSRSNGVTSQSAGLEKFLGKKGLAATDLHPAGLALLEDNRVDVITRGEYIEKGTAIVVCEVTGNQIIVNKEK